MIALLTTGFLLSLDNFRTSVTLGPLRFRWWRSVLIAAVFGFFDGVAPLAGILLGHYFGQLIGGPVADFAGPVVLALYGLYLITQTLRKKASEDTEYLWCVFGLPLPLSLDNVVAGAGLGLIGLPPVVPAALFGVITFVMSLIGLQLGRAISHLVPIRIRWEFVTGTGLIIEAILFALGVLQLKRSADADLTGPGARRPGTAPRVSAGYRGWPFCSKTMATTGQPH